MKKPSVPSRCGSVCAKPGTRAWSHSGTSARRSSAGSPCARPGTPARRPRSRRARSCRSSTRACRPGAARRRRRAGSPPARARAARGRSGRLAPARVGPRRERAEVRARRVDEHAVVARAARAARRRRRVRTSTRAPMRAARAPQRVGAAGMALDGDQLALVAHQRGEVGRLAAGRGAQVEHALAGPRREQPRDRHRGARLRHERAAAPTPATANASNGPSSTQALGQAGRRAGRHGQARRELGRVGAQRVDAQRGLGRLVAGGHQRARLVRAERVPPQLGDPLGVGVRERGLGGRGVGQRGDQRGRLARGRGAARR